MEREYSSSLPKESLSSINKDIKRKEKEKKYSQKGKRNYNKVLTKLAISSLILASSESMHQTAKEIVQKTQDFDDYKSKATASLSKQLKAEKRFQLVESNLARPKKEELVIEIKKPIVLDTSPYRYAKPPALCAGGKCIWDEEGIFPLSPEHMPPEREKLSPEEYLRIIKYFNVDDSQNLRYMRSGTRSNPKTYCNTYVSDVTKAMGVEIPKFIRNINNGWYTGDIRELSAAHQYYWLQREGKDLGWTEISSEDAIDFAQEGYPTVASHPDHIVMVIPGEGTIFEGKNYPQVSHAGWDNSSSIDLPSAYLRFFYPEKQEDPLNLEKEIKEAPEQREKIKFFVNLKQYEFVPLEEARQLLEGKYLIQQYEDISLEEEF